jgi:GT2 family glycosyltransferase
MENLLVSVILPVYNGERLLAESIACVLRQTYHPVELIVVDDGSTDGTAGVAADFGEQIRYFYLPHAGPAAARNLGVRKANGEFIAFIDADDLWPEDKLRLHMNCFMAFPELDIVQGLIHRIKLLGQVQGRIIGAEIDFLFIYTNLGAMVMRRSVFDRIGLLGEDILFNEDTDFWLRAREADLRILVLRRLSLIYRIHGRNLTTGGDLKSMGFFDILQRSLERRRRAFGYVRPVPPLSFLPDLQAQSSRSAEVPDWPSISVVLQVGPDREDFGKALENIRRQNYPSLELLVTGNLIGELQSSIGESFGQVVWIEVASPEPADQLNAAVERSHGELITFLDAEAEWTPGKLRSQVDYLRSHPEEGFVVGRTRHILQPAERYSSELIDGLAFRKSLGDLLGTLMVRRAVSDKVGGFASGLPGMEETDWLLRARDAGFPQKMMPNVFLYRFVHPETHMVNTEQMKSALLASVRASVHRKRIAVRGQ